MPESLRNTLEQKPQLANWWFATASRELRIWRSPAHGDDTDTFGHQTWLGCTPSAQLQKPNTRVWSPCSSSSQPIRLLSGKCLRILPWATSYTRCDIST